MIGFLSWMLPLSCPGYACYPVRGCPGGESGWVVFLFVTVLPLLTLPWLSFSFWFVHICWIAGAGYLFVCWPVRLDDV